MARKSNYDLLKGYRDHIEQSTRWRREEGFDEIATSFRLIAKVEEKHEKRYRKLLENIKKGHVFKKSSNAY